MMGYGIGPDPSGRSFPLFIVFILIIYYCCLLTQPRGLARCSLHYFGLGTSRDNP
ncbi:hypothetical protein Hanom_Chr06g00522561 [Helianthus anomalus]